MTFMKVDDRGVCKAKQFRKVSRQSTLDFGQKHVWCCHEVTEGVFRSRSERSYHLSLITYHAKLAWLLSLRKGVVLSDEGTNSDLSIGAAMFQSLRKGLVLSDNLIN